MNTTSGHALTLRMLLSEANVHERNGKKKEAVNIRVWVAHLLSEQSKLVRSVWGWLSRPSPAAPAPPVDWSLREDVVVKLRLGGCIDPVWDPIRSRPDFQQLLSDPEQIGLGKYRHFIAVHTMP
jgi:hypothetical protein